MRGLIGRKVGMTRLFDKASGRAVPVTVIEAGGNVIHQVKTVDHDGYRAVQLGYGVCAERRLTKAEMGHCRKFGGVPTRTVKEFPLELGEAEPTPGQKVGVEILENVRFVDVTGTSKGRGFTGTIKRHNFQRGRETHGNTNHREAGSVGSNTYPAHVIRGKRMAGQHGNAQRTARGLEVVGLEKEAGLVYVKGAVPGANKGIVYIKKNAAKR
jgi:large subunit ribosomal protein L3